MLQKRTYFVVMPFNVKPVEDREIDFDQVFVDSHNGALLHWLRVDDGIAEIYDVAVLPS